MSYADIAAKGPKQSDADKVPHQVSEILHDDSGVHSLDSLQSSNAHVQSLSSDTPSYSEQELTAERAARERREGERFADEVARETGQFVQRVENEAGLLGGSGDATSSQQTGGSSNNNNNNNNNSRGNETTTQQKVGARFEAAEKKAKEEFSELQREAGVGKEKAGKKAGEVERWAERNKGNPVVVGNAVVLSALAGVLGFGAYRLTGAQAWSWRVVGVWAGAVGLFAVGDYFLSSYLFKKYPTKK